MAQQISDRSLERTAKLLLAAFVLMALATAAYYVIDRQQQPNVPLVDREVERLEEMVSRDPENVAARVAVGDAYLTKTWYDEAIYQYQEVLKLSDDNQAAILQAAILGLGTAYLNKGDSATAIEYFDRFLALNKDKSAAVADRRLEFVYYQLGRVYLAQRKYDLAAERLKSALAIDRTDADALYLLGSALQAKGEHKDAVKAYRSAVSFVPDFVEAYRGMAQTYQSLGERAHAGYPEAMVAFYSGDKRGALRQLEATAAAVTDDAEVFWALGMAREDAGQKEQAIEAYRRALLINPEHGLAKSRLNRLEAK